MNRNRDVGRRGSDPTPESGPHRPLDGPVDADREVRAAFRALRARMDAAGRTPDFDAMMARARARAEAPGAARPPGPARVASRRRTLTRWAPFAAAAAAAGLLWVTAPSPADREFQRLVTAYTRDVNAGALRSPTASLLRTPGIDLGSVPSVGDVLPGPSSNLSSDTPQPGGRDS